MVVLVIQTFLLLAIAFVIGWLVGHLLKRLLGAGQAHSTEEAIQPVVSAQPSETKSVAAEAAKPAAAPVMPSPPMPKKVSAALKVEKSADPKPVPKQAEKSAKTADLSGVVTASGRVATIRKPVKPPKESDKLQKIKGIGPVNEKELNKLGITTFAQIAAWNQVDEEDYGATLSFPGRIERENWVSQAKAFIESSSLKQEASGEFAGLKEARNGKPDALTNIDGLGPALEKKLHKLGIFHFDQLAALTVGEQEWLGAELGFPGRVERENWSSSAKRMAKGGSAAAPAKKKKGAIRAKR